MSMDHIAIYQISFLFQHSFEKVRYVVVVIRGETEVFTLR